MDKENMIYTLYSLIQPQIMKLCNFQENGTEIIMLSENRPSSERQIWQKLDLKKRRKK
jgi:hypothetical protein